MKKKVSILGVGVSFLLTGCGLFGSNEGPATPIAPTPVESVEQTTEKTTVKERNTSSSTRANTSPNTRTNTSKNEYEVKVVSHSIEKNYNGKDTLVIEYAWTNNSDKETSFMFSCSDKVYQNGVECSSVSILIDGVDSTKQMTDIKPGVTYNLKIGYELLDMTNAHVEVTDLYGKTVFLEETIDLGGGEGSTVVENPNAKTQIRIVDAFLSKDYEKKDILVVHYEFTNGEDRATAFYSTFDDKAYQNGVECSDLTMCDDVDAKTALASIKPGVTTIVEEGYVLEDMSDVEIEIKKYLSKDVFFSQTLKIKDKKVIFDSE